MDTVKRQHTLDMNMFMPEFDRRVAMNSPLALATRRGFEGAKPNWTPREVQVLGSTAVATYYTDGSTRWPDGTVDTRPRRVTEVWINENGTWKEAHYHDSVHIAPTKTATSQ